MNQFVEILEVGQRTRIHHGDGNYPVILALAGLKACHPEVSAIHRTDGRVEAQVFCLQCGQIQPCGMRMNGKDAFCLCQPDGSHVERACSAFIIGFVDRFNLVLHGGGVQHSADFHLITGLYRGHCIMLGVAVYQQIAIQLGLCSHCRCLRQPDGIQVALQGESFLIRICPGEQPVQHP